MSLKRDEEYANRLCTLLAKTRSQADLSRKKLSEQIGVSESTVKTWEAGQSAPTLSYAIRWLYVTGNNPFKSALDFFWPDIYKNISEKTPVSELRIILKEYLKNVAGPQEIRKLRYLVSEDYHGYWDGILDVFCARSHSSLETRYRIGEIIHLAYEFAVSNGVAAKPRGMCINPMIVTESLKSAKSATLSKQYGYSFIVNRDDLDKISSFIMIKARKDAGVSYRFLAKALGKTERTIRNWESCIEPSVLDMNAWFNALEKPLWAYLLHLAMPCEEVEKTKSDLAFCAELCEHFETCDENEVKKLCFLIFADHGSFWHGILEMMIEYVCTPVCQRILSSKAVILGYELDAFHNNLVATQYISPDIDNVKSLIERGTVAAKNGSFRK